nr:hypothetical protein [uncultured Cohaesibacter sp.]
MSKKFAVWCMQRTGGTSFMGLIRTSHESETCQEPFNGNREFVYLRDEFAREVNRTGTAPTISDPDLLKYNLKICYEYTPKNFNEAVFNFLEQNGYFQILLLRDNEQSRLESLALAELTKAFGVKKAKGIYPKIQSGEIELPPVNMQTFQRHAKNCFQRTRHITDIFRRHRLPIYHYEQFFAGSFDEQVARHQALLDEMAFAGQPIKITSDTQTAREEYFKSRNQNSGAMVDYIPNIHEVREAIRDLSASKRTKLAWLKKVFIS